jgi:hypothetical protein
LPLLEDVLRDFPAIEVVISSDWRHYDPLETLKSFFSPDLRARIIDVTTPPGEVPDVIGDRVARHRECAGWIARNRPDGANWIAIDDDEGAFRRDWLEPGRSDLLVTSQWEGMTPADALELRKRLGSLELAARNGGGS